MLLSGDYFAAPSDDNVEGLTTPKRRRLSAGASGDYARYLRETHRDNGAMQERHIRLDEACFEADRKDRGSTRDGEDVNGGVYGQT